MQTKSKIAVLITLASIISTSKIAAWSADQPTTANNSAPCVSWKSPTGKPKFILLCIHGLGLYSRSWADFGQRMARNGAAVYAIDVRGFGSWMKAQGQEDVDFKACLKDVKETLESIRHANPGVPLFLMGESMGGAIALRSASMNPELMDGLISAVPASERFQQKKTDLKVALGFLRGPNRDMPSVGKDVVKQAVTSKTEVDGKKVTDENEKLSNAWESDPLDRMNLSPKELVQFQAFMNDNHEAAKNITNMPVLFMLGLDDKLVKPDGTWDLVKEIGTSDRTMVAVPSTHLIFEEGQAQPPKIRRESMLLLLAWIGSRLQDIETPPPVARTIDAALAAKLTQGKPGVLVFYANWADQCSQVDGMVNRGKMLFPNRINFVKLDVDDPANAELIKSLEVGPIPTVVFMRPNGSVSSTLIGQSDLANIRKGVADLLR